MSDTAALSKAQKQAIRWQSRLGERDCPPQVRRDFEQWLASSPENVEAFNTIQYFWDQFGLLSSVGESEIKEARRFAKQAQSGRRIRNVSLLALVALVGLSAFQPDWALKLSSRHYQTARGETTDIELSDGGSIKLNTDSDIRVADLFGWRKAWLKRGEAWFTIHHNPGQPFEVVTTHAQIRDIGTQFNVYSDANKTTVSVLEGEVALASANGEALRLTANQQGSIENSGRAGEKTEINAETTGSWRSGVLIFQNQRLHQVLRELARYHLAEFNVLEPAVANLVISGRFSTTDLNETLNTLSQGMHLNIKQQRAGQFLISKAK
ncbi:FecR domain-containing protein [Methylomonas sp. SURF-2]|uniref:FecR domain-containing protein n=1 Tax=Methylomonas subterranea TaxID=2952225 RepID=A0ABT1TI16_9GAMM|nr:FecR domain-containing protein [Methylomonas sp. SURF-2]MCQ8104732.1 FecR domain-containing protein [Methylomonas sp. SURF-2]